MQRRFFFVFILIAVVAGSALVVGSSAGRAFSQVQKLEVSAEGKDAYFGFSIGLEGDTALIGSFADELIGGTQASGAVYAFERVNGQWVQEQKLTPSDPAAANVFGWSLARDGDRALIGYGFAGVYYFERVNGQWIEKQQLVASEEIPATNTNLYGYSLALEGNLAVVSDFTNQADGEEGEQHGAVYVYQLVNGSWIEQQKLTAPDAHVFGFDVAIENGEILVGAHGTDNGMNVSKGAVFVFGQINGVWTQTQKLTGAHDGFGLSVNATDNLMVVGVIDNLSSPYSSTAPYVFQRVNGQWIEQQQLIPSDLEEGGENTLFAYDAAIQGNTIVITKVVLNAGGGTGAAYIFKLQNGTWVETQKIVADDVLPGDEYGIVVGFDGDTVMIGSGACTEPDVCPGAVYVYTDPELVPTATPTTQPPMLTHTPDAPATLPPLTASPTPTHTPLPDGTVDLLMNGGFESELNGWKLKNPTKDKVKCDKPEKVIAFEGACVFQFKGGAGENSKLQQSVDLAVNPVAVGDTLTLDGAVWTKGSISSKVMIKVKYASLPTAKITLNVAGATAKQWTNFSALQPTLTLAIVDTPIAVKVQIKHSSASGKVRYDALSLMQQSNILPTLGLPQ